MTDTIAGPVQRQSQPTILVVDDDLGIRTLLAEFLSARYDVVCAQNGSEAWDILQLRAVDVDLVITDIRMPGLDGVTLLGMIRDQYPAIGVIVVSGAASVRVAIQAMRNGAFDYLVKPFQGLEELDITVERYFERQQLESKLAEYIELRQEMMTHMKVRTFLCLDVAGSTRMKEGEDPFLVQYTFKRYHGFVQGIVAEHHGVIHGTAGDGIMCCFESAQDAVRAGMAIDERLSGFNRESNKLSAGFRVRSGVHTGAVIVGRDGRVSEMFASTLDITGHIQKQADVGQLEISQDTRNAISNLDDFEDAGKSVDGVGVFVFVGAKSPEREET